MKSKITQSKEHKEEFQLERIALFSDAVFAIAITLLIIEIKVPEIHSSTITDAELWHGLHLIFPKFVGFFISFFVIGLYWLAHHRIFEFVARSNQKLLSNNLLFLLPIVIMPFSTAFLSEYYVFNLKVPFLLYTLNIGLAGFFNLRLWKIVGNPKYNLSDNLNSTILNYNMARASIIPLVFICTFLLSFLIDALAMIVPLLTPFIIQAIKRYYKKKYPETMDEYLS